MQSLYIFVRLSVKYTLSGVISMFISDGIITLYEKKIMDIYVFAYVIRWRKGEIGC